MTCESDSAEVRVWRYVDTATPRCNAHWKKSGLHNEPESISWVITEWGCWPSSAARRDPIYGGNDAEVVEARHEGLGEGIVSNDRLALAAIGDLITRHLFSLAHAIFFSKHGGNIISSSKGYLPTCRRGALDANIGNTMVKPNHNDTTIILE